MIISLDGFIAGPEGHLDWMISPDPEREAEHLQFLGSVDTILVAHGVYASRSASKGKTPLRPFGCGRRRLELDAQLAEDAHRAVAQRLERVSFACAVICSVTRRPSAVSRTRTARPSCGGRAALDQSAALCACRSGRR
jgi:hypothetical protein